uniref:Uncharacterized protein n=1 Tax=viral metagenome TaxID=1070528 RepID=A0A6M3M6S1_9ZZZZ
MTKLKLGQCQVEGCSSEAKYKLFRTLKGKKEWLSVCRLHEKHIGDENMVRSGGRYEEGEK